jgi:hypothetical protein
MVAKVTRRRRHPIFWGLVVLFTVMSGLLTIQRYWWGIISVGLVALLFVLAARRRTTP